MLPLLNQIFVVPKGSRLSCHTQAMLVFSVYLLNLLCALVPCDPQFRSPEVQGAGTRLTRGRVDPALEAELGPPRVGLRSGGQVEGYWMTSVSGRRFRAFEGIPFAVPPVGPNRFRPPVRVGKWKGLLMAKKPGPVCLQLNPLALYRTVGQEDCLTINVYSAQSPEAGKGDPGLPVLVWIHGGAYLYGSGAVYGPAYLLTQNIVLVSFNYRLGVLGFLSTGSEASPGNNGLKDQALALQWVRDNIGQFGGDPSNVTLIGHSAGGASTHFHMMSEGSRGLFKAAISLSGTGMNYWALSSRDRALSLTNRLAKKMRCPGVGAGSGRDTVNCLRKRNPVFLVSNQMDLLEFGPLPIVLFSPVIEAPGQGAFLTARPEELYAQNRVARVPWITSVTKEEGFFQLQFIYGFGKLPEFRSKWESLAPLMFDYDWNRSTAKSGQGNHKETTKRIIDYYFKGQSPKTQSYAQISKPLSDRFFTRGVRKASLEHSKIAPTYSYIFDYKGKYNVGNYMGLKTEEWGVGHAEDVFYIFNSTKLYSGFRSADPEAQISQFMVNTLTNFVTKSKPVYTNEYGEDHDFWSPIDPSSPHFLHIGQKGVEMIPDPFLPSAKFWDSLGFNDE